MTAGSRGKISAELIFNAERRWSNLSTTDAETRAKTLEKLLDQCAKLKTSLSRHPEIFGFIMSAPGAEFTERRMTSIGGDGEDGEPIKVSLWPAVYRLIDNGPREHVIEPELVYMKA